MRSTLNCNVLDQRNWEQDHKIVSTQIHTTCSTKQITIGFGLPHGNVFFPLVKPHLYSSERRVPCVVMIRLPNQHGKSLFVTKSEEDLETNRPNLQRTPPVLLPQILLIYVTLLTRRARDRDHKLCITFILKI